jgi:RNA ligase (TIGR02306 family)
MAFFGVTVETIEKVWPHPNADRLALSKAKGLSFQFVILKDSFKEGDKILYFPIDSKLPQELVIKLGMEGKFSGAEKNIIKTLKLRNEISQGYVTSPTGIIPEDLLDQNAQQITEFLGVTKFELEPVELKDVRLISLPSGLSDYDIEGADRNQSVIDQLMDEDVVISEKMEGENNNTAIDNDGQTYVSTRNRCLVEKEGFKNRYCNVSREFKLADILLKNASAETVALYYEICGPGLHCNVYKLEKDTIYLFDIKKNGRWLPFGLFEAFLQQNGLSHLMAPIVFKGKLRDFLAGRTIQEASNGDSLVNPKVLREGIVIKPLVEQNHSQLGRLIIKQRSPEYLAKNKDN